MAAIKGVGEAGHPGAEAFFAVAHVPIDRIEPGVNLRHKARRMEHGAQELRTINALALHAGVVVVRGAQPRQRLAGDVLALLRGAQITVSGAGT